MKLRVWFKKVLHRPSSTPNEWVHGKFSGALQDITELVMSCRKKASEKMCNSTDEVAALIGEDIDTTNWRNFAKIGAGFIPQKNLKSHWEKERSG